LLLLQYGCIVSHGDNFMRANRDRGGPLSMRVGQTGAGKDIAAEIDRYYRLGRGSEPSSCH
jgi:hypothetical protein